MRPRHQWIAIAKWNAILVGGMLVVQFAVCHANIANEPGPPTDRLPLVLPWAHALPVRSIAFSADGKRIVTGGGDCAAIVWEASTGRQLGTLSETPQDMNKLRNDQDEIASVGISADGRYIATGFDHGTIVVWDTDSRRKRRTLLWHSAPIVSLAFRRNGTELFSASADKTAVLWDLETGLKRQLLATKSPIVGGALSRNGLLAATNEEDGAVVLWNIDMGKRAHTLRENAQLKPAADADAPVKGPQYGNDVAFSLDGKWLMAASPDKTVAIWNADTGGKDHVFDWYQEVVNSVGFSADGKRVVTTCYDRTASGVYDHVANVLDSATGKKVRDITLDFSTPIGLSPDATQIAVVSAGHIPGERQGVTLLSSESGKPLCKLQSHIGGIPVVAHDGKQMALAEYNEGGSKLATLVFQFDKQPPKTLRLSALGWGTTFSSDGRELGEVNKDRIDFWNLDSGKCRPGLDLSSFPVLKNAIFSPDLKQVLTLSYLGFPERAHSQKPYGKEGTSPDPFGKEGSGSKPGMRLTDLTTGKSFWSVPLPDLNDRSIASWPGGKHIAIATSKVIIYAAATGLPIRTLEREKDDQFTALAFSPSGNLLAVAPNDGQVGIWDIEVGRRLRVFPGVDGGGTEMAFSPNGRTLAINNESNELTLWNMATGKEDLVLTARDVGYFHKISFSLDSKVVAVIGHSMTVYWDATNGERRLSLYFLDGGKDWFAVTPSGLFDGSEAGRQIVGVRIGEGMNVVAVEQMAARFRRPGLLNAVLSGEPLHEEERKQ